VDRSGIVERRVRAHDASHYLVVPAATAVAADLDAVVGLLRRASPDQPVTFRSGGTSLSGQAQGRGLLVDTRRGFRRVEVLDEGRRVRAQPGATVRQVNRRLAPYGYTLGPDPASEAACTIGGIVANNSSGMTCGTDANAYRTVESMVLVLADGTVIDSGPPDADDRLRAVAPDVHRGLFRLRDHVRSDPAMVAEIRRQFSIKNTMGYGVNAFLDFDDPIDILVHLAVGSEGTLAFVAEVTFVTLPVRPHVATGLVVLDSVYAATDALPSIVATGPAAVELLDAASLRVARRDPRGQAVLPAIDIDAQAALLVEFQELSSDALERRLADAEPVLSGLRAALPAVLAVLASDAGTRADLWHVRKGLYASVAGGRPAGTSALLEDIAVPVPQLAAACAGLLGLFDRHSYEDCVVFGHAKDGNIHFLLNERFGDPASLTRYEEFTEDMVELVLGYGGTLKAEHGTGRIMAPFVRRQYGDDLYGVMRDIRRLLDPRGVLNPDVLISDDATIHLRDLKAPVVVDPEADRCVECGYCEPVCPSRDLTLTPRERIVMRRELAAARDRGDTGLAADIDAAFAYDGIETCAADGMCQTACPVHIDTGELVKRLRSERQPKSQARAWSAAARHWGAAVSAASFAMTAARAAPAAAQSLSRLGRRVLGEDVVPRWDPGLPPGGSRRHSVRASGHADRDAIVLLPSCTGTMFGPRAARGGVTAAFLALCRQAGVFVIVPPGVNAACCGTPWRSKGALDGYRIVRARTEGMLRAASGDGRLVIVSDASSCTEGLRHAVPGLTVVDAVSFTASTLLPLLPPADRVPRLVLHPTCSSTRLGLDADLRTVAAAAADEVVVPVDWGCCGFAGDRGMLHPELTASATRAEAASVAEVAGALHASCNRTCEVGMTRATGRPYRHVLEVLADAMPVEG
jgi:D-lactate dehydrogenase